MKNALVGALIMGAFVLLTSFALTRTSAAAGGPAWTVAQYQLDRAFRMSIQLSPQVPQTLQLPGTGGVIITQVVLSNAANSILTIAVNGIGETLRPISGAEQHRYEFNPPIIARPGDVLTFSTSSPFYVDAVIAGYTTLPGET